MYRHTANAISLARMPASLALLAIYEPHSASRILVSLGLAVAIIASDFVDGQIARKYNLNSKLGYVLDGLGDRAFHVAAYLVLIVAGVLNIFLAWFLIFREISQYAVRLTEIDWHSTQSRTDRALTRFYTATVQASLMVELGRTLLAPNRSEAIYAIGLNLVLFAAAIGSYSRIVPRLWRAWQRALNE